MLPQRTVVITGASTGIGRACALHLDRLGWTVFAGFRHPQDAESLRAAGSERLTPIQLDVAQPDSIAAARAQVERALGAAGLGGLVNNAGIAYGGPVELLDLDELRGAFEVNFFGLIAVTQAFLPRLRLARGRIVNMSSNSGLVAAPFISPYSTSKWALEALSDAMRVELHPWGICVSVIEPGAINTPIWTKARQTAQKIREQLPGEGRSLYDDRIAALAEGMRPHGISPDHVARVVEHALAASRPRTRYVVGIDAALTRWVARLPDSLRDALFRLRIKRGR